MNEPSGKPTIAVFDSGIGGLTILSALTKKIPAANYIYFGDTANAPYGPRAAEEIFELSRAAIENLLTHQPDVVVIACNTVTSTSIMRLREEFPTVTFVGVEPAVKPAAAKSQVQKIVVAATTATLNSESYQALKKLWASGIEVIDLPKPEWVKMIENNASVDEILTLDAQTFLATGADVLVLACTHFPILKPKLQQLLPRVTIIDSAEPVADQVQRVLQISDSSNVKGKLKITWIFTDPSRPRYPEKVWTIAQKVQ